MQLYCSERLHFTLLFALLQLARLHCIQQVCSMHSVSD
jgi:hypothetical protein